MRTLKTVLIAGAAIAALAAPAAATITVNFTAHVSNADFLPPLPSTLSDRGTTLTGSFTYLSGLPDDT